jgi:hypothetical protein
LDFYASGGANGALKARLFSENLDKCSYRNPRGIVSRVNGCSGGYIEFAVFDREEVFREHRYLVTDEVRSEFDQIRDSQIGEFRLDELLGWVFADGHRNLGFYVPDREAAFEANFTKFVRKTAFGLKCNNYTLVAYLLTLASRYSPERHR